MSFIGPQVARAGFLMLLTALLAQAGIEAPYLVVPAVIGNLSALLSGDQASAQALRDGVTQFSARLIESAVFETPNGALRVTTRPAT